MTPLRRRPPTRQRRGAEALAHGVAAALTGSAVFLAFALAVVVAALRKRHVELAVEPELEELALELAA